MNGSVHRDINLRLANNRIANAAFKNKMAVGKDALSCFLFYVFLVIVRSFPLTDQNDLSSDGGNNRL